jgi:hypothetical protein
LIARESHGKRSSQIRSAPFTALGIAFMVGGCWGTHWHPCTSTLTDSTPCCQNLEATLQVHNNSFFSPSEKCHLSLLLKLLLLSAMLFCTLYAFLDSKHFPEKSSHVSITHDDSSTPRL